VLGAERSASSRDAQKCCPAIGRRAESRSEAELTIKGPRKETQWHRWPQRCTRTRIRSTRRSRPPREDQGRWMRFIVSRCASNSQSAAENDGRLLAAFQGPLYASPRRASSGQPLLSPHHDHAPPRLSCATMRGSRRFDPWRGSPTPSSTRRNLVTVAESFFPDSLHTPSRALSQQEFGIESRAVGIVALSDSHADGRCHTTRRSPLRARVGRPL